MGGTDSMSTLGSEPRTAMDSRTDDQETKRIDLSDFESKMTLADESPPPESTTNFFFSCPPVRPISTVTSLIVMVLLFYGTCWSLIGESVLPGGSIFGLFAISIAAYVGGQLVRLIRIPTLVGMLIVGFLLRNVPYINIAKDIPEEWAGNIRNLALVLILLRAGLEVDSNILRRKSGACCKIIFIPFIIECVVAAVAAKYLFEMPWIYAILLGFMLSAVSPAVVLPVMLKMQKKGIGTEKGIPTLVIAVAGIDDVLAVTGFEVVLGLIFSPGSLGWTIAQGPLQVIVGIAYGVILGLFAWYIPNPDEKSTVVFRFLILSLGGLFVLFVSHAVNWGATGALGCICLPFVAALRWKTGDWDAEHDPVSKALAFVWRIVEPFLFGLVGSEIRIEYLHPSTVGLGLATLFIALALRMLVCIFAAYSAGFTLKEQIFVTFAGLPKATVQAAIGPVAFAYAKKSHMGPEIEEFGIQILTVAVLSILITAPLGATAIAALAPRLLENSTGKMPDKTMSTSGKVSILDSSSTILTIYNSQIIEDKKPSTCSEIGSGDYIARL